MQLARMKATKKMTQWTSRHKQRWHN